MAFSSTFRRICVGMGCALPLALLAADTGISKEGIDVFGKKHQYFVFVPSIIADRQMPMLVLLHGSGRNGQSLIDPWKRPAEREHLILVAPNAVNPAGWQNPIDGPEVLIAIANEVAKQYPVDKRRVYLFGHSAGAVFALLMPLWEPRYFAAVAVHAGAIPRSSELLAKDAAHSVKRKTPIYIQVGTSDRIFPLDAVRETRNLFASNGFTVELREISRHDHNYYAISDDVNDEAWRFFRDRTAEAK